MQLACVHCGNEFSISAEQLGTRGRCPHCRAQITLPKADSAAESGELEAPKPWLENSISGLGSFVLHLVALLLLALIPWGGRGETAGESNEIFIGDLAVEHLTNDNDDQLEEKEVTKSEDESFDEPLNEILPPGVAQDETADLQNIEFSASGGANSAVSFESSTSSASAGGEDFEGLVKRLKRDGLDIVISFDSTSSMSGEINQVKSKIERISNALTKLIPKTKISICTYRDEGDAYVVKGLPLTSNMSEVQAYLDDIYAGGGGDIPEAVHQGLRWPVTNNQFRPKARKVILLFGDEGPHKQYEDTCIRLASEFKNQLGGVVSTVTCRADKPIDAFVDIAQAGGGEAFLTRDEREIMSQLIILVFGSKHKSKVLEAFELLEEK
jgi:Mg-chelatase subunit ChlD/DNA-directed RNA polymerase subunit RPC12/RpoP